MLGKTVGHVNTQNEETPLREEGSGFANLLFDYLTNTTGFATGTLFGVRLYRPAGAFLSFAMRSRTATSTSVISVSRKANGRIGFGVLVDFMAGSSFSHKRHFFQLISSILASTFRKSKELNSVTRYRRPRGEREDHTVLICQEPYNKFGLG